MPAKPVHPGKILAEELAAVGVTPTELARQIDVPPNRICQIVRGKRAISGDTALRLARWFGTRPERWLKLQAAYELKLAERSSGPAIQRLPTRTSISQIRIAARTKAAT